MRPYVHTNPLTATEVAKLRESSTEWLNSQSDSMCLAKWYQVTLHLQNGHTHSCHHPNTHKIPLEEIQKDPIKSFYVKNADKKMKLKLVAQNKNKHKAFKGLSEVEGILSLQGNDLYLHFNDKNGVAQSVKLGGGDIFGYGKYKEKKQGLLKPVQKMFKETLQFGKVANITEEDLVQFEQLSEKELEDYETTKTEEAEKYFQYQLELQRTRRRA